MSHPLSKDYDEKEDIYLVEEALSGSRVALEQLCRRHQPFIYNLALKFVQMPEDAQDITQDVMIKIITKLAQFENKSSFRTWLYRIVVNHFYDLKKTKKETVITGFDFYGNFLDQTPDIELSTEEESRYAELIDEAKFGCSAGMLLCLNREQRMAYILSDIFEADHNLGSEIMGISKANYRKRVSRARKDLHNFMQKKCGLVNRKNPCRCAGKTKSYIKKGLVNPEKLVFNANYKLRVYEILKKEKKVCDTIDEAYIDIFQDHPYQTENIEDIRDQMNKLLDNKRIFLDRSRIQ